MRFVSYMRRSAKILMLILENIIGQILYERCAYESIEEKSLIVGYVEKTTNFDDKNNIHPKSKETN